MSADSRDKAPLDVQRNHRNAVETGELEQRHVKSGIIAPDLSPFGRLQEGLLRQLALDPIVQHGLQATRKCFEADDKISPAAMERRQGLQLQAMVIRVGVLIPEQHDSGLRG